VQIETKNDTQEFMDYLTGWIRSLPVLALRETLAEPQTCAILSVDVINGFCSTGPLASPRVNQIVQPIVRLFEAAWKAGLRQIVLAQDTHEPDAVEFGSWPGHCVRGTYESEAVDAFKALPFYERLTTIPKNSINAAMNTGLPAWLAARPELSTFIVVGDCTDLCTYQLAMYLRLEANAHQLKRRVIVPADCVDTYDFPVQAALAAGAMPHPADILHPLFLQHMALNGVEVVKSIE
jgi:nicotinamidase-related amidase